MSKRWIIVPTLMLLLFSSIDALPQYSSKRLYFDTSISEPKEELTTGTLDLTANYINAVQHFFPLMNGSSIRISIKEQNFDPSDIDIRNRHFLTGFESPTSSSHAAIMATAIAGGGNTSELAKGVA